MAASTSHSQEIQRYLDRIAGGDESARRALIQCACSRLERLTRKMLRGWQRVHRWEETGDVLQNALLRLDRALAAACPRSPAEFFRLAALQIRRELNDLARHYYGPQGQGAKHGTGGVTGPVGTVPVGCPAAAERGSAEDDPAQLAAWAEFHRAVGELPDEEREIFDLLWYQELSHAEAAELLGVSVRTVKRRWAAARLRLHAVLAQTLALLEPAGPPPAPPPVESAGCHG